MATQYQPNSVPELTDQEVAIAIMAKTIEALNAELAEVNTELHDLKNRRGLVEHPDNTLMIESDDEAGTYTVKRGGQTMLRYTAEGEAQAFVTGYAEGFMRNVRLGASR